LAFDRPILKEDYIAGYDPLGVEQKKRCPKERQT